ncbi:ABC transporter permease [Roseivirga thermotolerans]|uniref:ABC transporter permease n=1 Tax=Roseivirga thermotolerans TaxID=1758176 RepID=UPI00273DB949|nr:ABC transporter permease [Roseivirga thermotolerans]
MFRNYLSTTLRKLRKQRFFTIINILGLTIALTACCLIALFVRDELSFDRFHEDFENIYRLNSLRGEEQSISGYAYADFIEYVDERVPEVSSYARIVRGGALNLLESDNNEFYSKSLIYVESNFLEFFSFDLLQGNAHTALSNPYAMVVTESLANKLFGEQSALGKEVIINKEQTYVVSGVVKDPPKNSSIQFETLLPIKPEQVENTFSEGYLSGNINFVKLNPNASLAQVEQSINKVKEVPNYGVVLETTNFRLMPLADQRLRSGYDQDTLLFSDIRMVYLFGSIGLVILILAIINYVNLVTAQSLQRAKEIGLRKVIGANKAHLAWLQVFESIVITTISLVFAFAVTERLIPLFNSLTSKDVSVSYFSSEFLVLIPLSGVFLGALAALYPSIRTSKVSPLVLVGRPQGKLWNDQRIKKALMLVQFSAAIILLLVTFTMRSQMRFLENSKVGFEKELLINVPLFKDQKDYHAILKSEVSKIKGIYSASVTDWMIGGYTSSTKYTEAPDQDSRERPPKSSVTRVSADESILSTLQVEVVEALEEFNYNKLDSTQLVVTESIVNELGWEDGILGKSLFEYTGKSHKVVAVIKDFHSHNFKKAIEPTTIQLMDESYGNEDLLIRLESEQHQETLKEVAEVYERIADRPFEYSYISDVLNRYYKTESDQILLFNVFSTLAMCISLLGLLGMISFVAQQRRKEISIRKVLGATLSYLVLLLNKGFIKLALIAFIVSVPVAYYASEKWLESFMYRVEVSPGVYIATLVGFILISSLVTLSQSLKVSRENPADVLRDE